MNAQEILNSPGYIVEANDPSGNKRYFPRTFRHPNLLSARQAAFQYAQDIQARSMRTHTLDITIHLIQINRTIISDSHSVICTVFRQRFQPNFIIQQGNPIRKSQSGPISLIPERIKEPEVFNSLQAVEMSMCEREYYHTHSHLI